MRTIVRDGKCHSKEAHKTVATMISHAIVMNSIEAVSYSEGDELFGDNSEEC
jgi:hypothetical protein